MGSFTFIADPEGWMLGLSEASPSPAFVSPELFLLVTSSKNKLKEVSVPDQVLAPFKCRYTEEYYNTMLYNKLISHVTSVGVGSTLICQSMSYGLEFSIHLGYWVYVGIGQGH